MRQHGVDSFSIKDKKGIEMGKLDTITKEMPKARTHISNVLHEISDKAKYDAEVKKLLSNKTILAWIMKHTMEEFKNYPIAVIHDCIEGEPEISKVKLRPGHTPEAITGNATSDQVVGEGEITYDIRFYAITPDGKQMKLLLNVEAQKNYYPGYDLVTRGIFYCARMLSAQLDTEFITDNYDDIKKVYSIWICMETPGYVQNTITEYNINQKNVVGDFHGKARYDLLSVVMVCLGKSETTENKLLGMLNTLLADELSVEEKENILSQEYGIETSVEVKEVLNTMCNLSDLIEEKGIERGIERGTENSIEKLLKKNFSTEEVAYMLDVDIIQVRNILEKIK